MPQSKSKKPDFFISRQSARIASDMIARLNFLNTRLYQLYALGHEPTEDRLSEALGAITECQKICDRLKSIYVDAGVI